MTKGKNPVLKGLSLLIMMLVITVWATQIQAQGKYPSRPIDIICPFAPGGSTDLMARVLGSYVSKKWGVAVNVINKPGGNTVPALLDLYNAAPNGYTMLADGINCTSLLPVVVKELPFKIMDRSFIAMICMSPSIVYVPDSSSYKNMNDLAADARKSPESFTWTSLGGTGSTDFLIRQFLKAIGVDVQKTKPVVTGGGSQSATLVAGGHVKMGSGSISATMPVVKAGTVRVLGVTGKNRDPSLPDVPTTAEVGYPTVQAFMWNSISGPPKLPPQIVEMWNGAVQEMLKDPDILAKMKNLGLVSLYKDARETIEYVGKETEEVKELWGLK